MEFGDAYISWLSYHTRLVMEMTKATLGVECNDNVGMTDSGYDIRYSGKISDIERMLSHDEWIT